MSAKPLDGLRLIELDAMGPVPLAAKILADLGADIVRIARAGVSDRPGSADLMANRSVVRLDLKSERARGTALDLIAAADGLLEGFRPGVMEKLGLGPQSCLAANSRLVYVRVTGWGQSGPLAPRAGHDLNYIAVTGVLHAIGAANAPPPPPLNLIGDYGGGAAFAVIGILAGILRARETGQGQVVDAAMVDGVAALSSAIHAMLNGGQWRDQPASNMLDGAAPFYRCYACADGKHVAVAALEPEFFALLLDGLGLERTRFVQRDRSGWAEMERVFAETFARRPRDAWATVFEKIDACVAPVLSFSEARAYPHNIAREIYAGRLPAAAPRFGNAPFAAEAGGEIEAVEALARWSRPPHRDIAPANASPIATSDD